MERALCVIRDRDILFDSDQYSDIVSADLYLESEDSVKEQMGEICEFCKENDIMDILCAMDNIHYDALIALLYTCRYSERMNLYVLPEYELRQCVNAVKKVEDVYIPVDYRKPRLYGYQVHLTDICNLNCKGCGHYCPVVEDPNFLNYDNYEKDILQIKKKFWGVQRLYLLGGEPLLNKEVDRFIYITRKVFPDADIRVSTNGLLLPQMKNEFWKAVRECNAHIEISCYKPTLEMLDKINEVLEKEGVFDTTIFWGERDFFYKQGLLRSHNDPVKSFIACDSKKCHFLRDGRLALCPAVYLRDIFNKKYNIEPQYEPDGIDLYDETIDGWQINRILGRPSVACAFCTDKRESFPWEKATKETVMMKDWMVD